MTKNQAINFTDNTCPFCSGRIIDYDRYSNMILSVKPITYSKCTKCHQEFIAKYEDGQKIYIKKDGLIQQFINRFLKM